MVGLRRTLAALITSAIGLAGLAAFAAPVAYATAGVDLSVDLTDNGAHFVVGQNGTFQVKVKNNGTATATGTTSVELGWYYYRTHFVSASGTGWSCATDADTYFETVSCQRTGTIAPGATAPTLTVTVAVQPDAYNATYSQATVSNPSDDNGAESDSQYVVVDGPDASVGITAPATMTVGTDASTTVTVTNTGTRAATGSVTLTVPQSSTLELRSATGTGWSCGFVGSDLGCTHAFAVAAGGSIAPLTVVVRPNRNAYPQTYAQVNLQGPTNATNNASTSGDYASASATINGVPDLSVTSGLQFTNPPLTVGSNETATLDLVNVGSVGNTGTITVTFSLPSGLAYVSRTGTGWTCGTGTGQLVCTRTANLAASTHAPLLTLTLAVTTPAYPSTGISAYVQNATGDDPNYGVNGSYNNSAYAYADVDGVADLALTDPDGYYRQVVAGSTSSVTLTAAAVSTLPVSGTTTVSADLPTGVTLQSSAGTGWSCGVASGHLTCTRSGTVAAGTAAPVLTLTLKFDASLAGSYQYVAFAMSNPNDVYDGNDTNAHQWYAYPAVDLQPYFSGTNPCCGVAPGQALSFTLNATNAGTEPATGTTTVTYTVPAGLTYVSKTNGAGFSCTKSGAVLTCTRTTNIPGSTAVVAATVNATVNAAAGSTVTHCLAVSNASDAYTGNDSTCSDFQVSGGGGAQDLTVSTSHAPATFTAGNNGTVRVTVSNAGGASTSGTVTAQLAAGTGLSLQSVSGTNWSCTGSGASSTCTTTATVTGGGSLPQLTAIVHATAAASPSSTVTATVSGGGQTNTSNDAATETVPVGSTAPTASFTASPTLGIAPVTVSFDASGSTGSTSYAWAFGDGSTGTGATASHTYSTPGTYNAVLTVTSSGGQTDTASHTISVGTSQPLEADAGDDVVTVSGAAVSFNGSGSQPSPGITAYEWDFGDGTTGTGPTPVHTYTNAGPGDLTRTVTLTTRVGAASDTDTATVLVQPPPGVGTGGLDVTVTNAAGGAALSGAALAVIDGFGNRYQATSDSSGHATLRGLANGSYTVYAYVSGFKPAAVTATVSGGSGTATVALDSGAVGATTVESDRLTYDEIVAAGIDPADPANNHVYEFVICLSFDENAVCQAEMTGDVNEEGHIYHGSFSGGGGSCTATECAVDIGGYDVRGSISFPAGPDYPVGQFLLIPGEARWLKEFFEVKMVTTNLSPGGFTFTDGTASIDLPDGMSLAPTATPQTLSQPVPDIPGGGGPSASKTTTWVLRGDEQGDYPLSAQYAATLEPVGAPIHLTAIGDHPLKVWAGAALHMTVRADSTATAGEPYRVRIGLTNVTTGADATDVYNPVVELKKQGASNFVYQPLERLAQGTAVIHPGDTFWTDDYVLFPTISGQLHPENSAVFHTGGDANVASTIGATLTPVPALATTATGTPGGVHLTWAAKAGATGYRIFKTSDATTQFGDTPEATVGAGTTSIDLPEPAGPAYYTVSSTVGGIPTAFHKLLPATALPVPTASIGDATVTEGVFGTVKANLTVRLSQAVTTPVTLRYDTFSQTADASDYALKAAASLTIPAGATTGVITVPIKGDALDEADESFTVVLSNPVNASIGRSTGTITIVDDDPSRPTRVSVADVSVGEGSGAAATAKVTLTASPPSASPITVRLSTSNGTATAPGDYTAKSSVVTIPAGAKGAVVPISVNGDTLDEADETVALTLSSPTGAVLGDATGTVTVLDDDPAAGLGVVVGDLSLDEGDTAGTPVNVPVTLTAPAPAGGVQVTYTTADASATVAGTDYPAKSGTLTIPGGLTSAAISVGVTGDGLFEPDETYTVTLSAPTAGATLVRPTGTVTIRNDDAAPAYTLSAGDAAHVEGQAGSGQAKVVVELSAPATTAVTVHWTLANGTAVASDYGNAATGTLTIPAGATSGVIGVAVKGDTTAEPDETFSVVLDNPVGATLARATGTVIVLNDD